jgi:RNA polymerase sporulation-specific sigma factor
MDAALKINPAWQAPVPGEDELVAGNTRFVRYLLNKMGDLPIDYAEAYSAGLFGLLKAARTFDTGAGIRFSTYSAQVIRNEILMAFRSGKRFDARMASLDAPVQDLDGDDIPLIALVADERENTERDVLDAEREAERRAAVEIFLSRLKPRDRQIFEMKKAGMGQVAIGRNIGLSQSFVSRTVKKWRIKEEDNRMRRLSQDERKEIEAMIRDKKSYREIKLATGVSDPTIASIKAKMGATREQFREMTGQYQEPAPEPEKETEPVVEVPQEAPVPPVPEPATPSTWNAHVCPRMPSNARVSLEDGEPVMTVAKSVPVPIEACPWCRATLSK